MSTLFCNFTFNITFTFDETTNLNSDYLHSNLVDANDAFCACFFLLSNNLVSLYLSMITHRLCLLQHCHIDILCLITFYHLTSIFTNLTVRFYNYSITWIFTTTITTIITTHTICNNNDYHFIEFFLMTATFSTAVIVLFSATILFIFTHNIHNCSDWRTNLTICIAYFMHWQRFATPAKKAQLSCHSWHTLLCLHSRWSK